jgi:hypothetical protein
MLGETAAASMQRATSAVAGRSSARAEPNFAVIQAEVELGTRSWHIMQVSCFGFLLLVGLHLQECIPHTRFTCDTCGMLYLLVLLYAHRLSVAHFSFLLAAFLARMASC